MVATEMAPAGANTSEIIAVTGHKTLAMNGKYVGAERQKATRRPVRTSAGPRNRARNKP